MIGKTISHYKIIEKLGEGGMGVVYKAEDTKLEREVAIKFLPHQIAVNSDERARFKVEAKAAASLNHNNIATIHAIEEIDDEMFIVMEYIKGQELKDKIESGPLAIDLTLEVAIQIAKGLQAAHTNGVVHRDIKSANVMLTAEGDVKIMDFGLAKLGGQTKLTKEGTTLGTVAYMSPEQARGDEVDHRSDIFSLGVLIYEMVTGQMPFKGDYEQAVIYSILNEDPKGIATASGRSDVPEELEFLILKCLEKSPQQRYESADEIINELERLLLDGRRYASVENKGDEPISKRRISRKAALIPASLMVIALLALLMLQYFSREDGEESIGQPSSSRIAVFPFSVRGGEDFAYLSEGMVDLISTKLNGAGDLRSVDVRTLLNHLAQEENGVIDPARGRSISNRFDAGLYVLGDILEVSGQLHINASLYDINQGNEAAAQATVVGQNIQLFELVDDLTGQLLTAQNIIDVERITSMAVLTTPSFPALKAYLSGEKEMRLGQPSEAIIAFKEAVAADDSFALAYYRLSYAASWVEDFDSLINRFVQLSPDGDYAVGFRALQAFVTGNEADQEQILNQLRQASDDEVWLANYFVSIDARDFPGGSRIARLLTDPTRSQEMQVHGHLSTSFAELSSGRLSAAKRELEAAAVGDPVLAREYRVLFAMLPFVPSTRDELLALRTTLGQAGTPPASGGLIPRRKAPHDGLHPLIHKYLLGCLSARLDDSEAALAYASELEDMQVPRVAGSLAKDLAQSLHARAAMVAGKIKEALFELEQAPMRVIYPFMFSSPLFSHSDDRFLRGELLNALGRHEEALRWYQSAAELAVYDLIYLAPAHQRQGEIYEKLGQPKKAIEHYERFLELWQHADEDLPDLIDARARLAKLKGEASS